MVDLASEQSLRLALGTVESGPRSWPRFFFARYILFLSVPLAGGRVLAGSRVAREEIRVGLARVRRGRGSIDGVGLGLTLVALASGVAAFIECHLRWGLTS